MPQALHLIDAGRAARVVTDPQDDEGVRLAAHNLAQDLARVGGRYSDDWHKIHLNNTRDVVPESNMPGYPWLAKNLINPDGTRGKMLAMQRLGVPYSNGELDQAANAVRDKTEQDALIAYLQVLGTSIKNKY